MTISSTLRAIGRTAAVVALAAASSAVLTTTGTSVASAADACPTGGAAATVQAVKIKRAGGPVTVAPHPTAGYTYFGGAQLAPFGSSSDPIQPGDRVTVTFKVADGCTSVPFTLASYNADLSKYLDVDARPEVTTVDPEFFTTQTVADSATGTYSSGTYSLTATVPNNRPQVATGGCPDINKHQAGPQTANGNGGLEGNPYASTCDGRPSENGSGTGQSTGKPCQGCVGNADNKNPKGQAPGGSDANAGYECDRNQGVGQGNPAHSGCSSTIGYQLDLYRGALITQLPGDGNVPNVATFVGPGPR